MQFCEWEASVAGQEGHEPHATINGARLTLSAAAETQLSGEPAESFLRVIGPQDYFCLLAFLPPPPLLR